MMRRFYLSALGILLLACSASGQTSADPDWILEYRSAADGCEQWVIDQDTGVELDRRQFGAGDTGDQVVTAMPELVGSGRVIEVHARCFTADLFSSEAVPLVRRFQTAPAAPAAPLLRD